MELGEGSRFVDATSPGIPPLPPIAEGSLPPILELVNSLT